MNNKAALAVISLIFLLSFSVARAQGFEADSSVTVLACSAAMGVTDGGTGFVFASAGYDVAGSCGPQPGDDAAASGAGLADIANGITYASADTFGPVGANRATSRGNLSDLVNIDAPAGVDSVQVFASIELVAESTGNFDFSQDFLFGRVSIPTAGEIEIRRCTPAICPTAPIQSDSVSQTFTVERGMFSGDYPTISVALNTTIDLVNGSGQFFGRVIVEIADGSGAVLSSVSGVFGTGTGGDNDADAVPNALDNCRDVPNPDQRDTNGDGFGNICDPDLNNDLEINFGDLALLKAAWLTGDEDADLNGDGIVNFGDLIIMKQMFLGPPGPGAEG